MTYEVEPRFARGRQRVHQVKRLYPGRSRTTVRFLCGATTSFGPLGIQPAMVFEGIRDEGPLTCARCQFVLESRQ